MTKTLTDTTEGQQFILPRYKELNHCVKHTSCYAFPAPMMGLITPESFWAFMIRIEIFIFHCYWLRLFIGYKWRPSHILGKFSATISEDIEWIYYLLHFKKMCCVCLCVPCVEILRQQVLCYYFMGSRDQTQARQQALTHGTILPAYFLYFYGHFPGVRAFRLKRVRRGGRSLLKQLLIYRFLGN